MAPQALRPNPRREQASLRGGGEAIVDGAPGTQTHPSTFHATRLLDQFLSFGWKRENWRRHLREQLYEHLSGSSLPHDLNFSIDISRKGDDSVGVRATRTCQPASGLVGEHRISRIQDVRKRSAVEPRWIALNAAITHQQSADE